MPLVSTGVSAVLASPGLSHPDSPIGFIHSAAYLIGRSLVLLAVRGALFSRSERAARIATALAASTGLVLLAVATVATITATAGSVREADGPSNSSDRRVLSPAHHVRPRERP